jgi:hypothetical protein
MAGLFNRSILREEDAPVYTANEGAVSDGSLQYVVEKGGNTSEVAYQEASGAPVESDSPLGYSVGAITIIFLNLSKMIGTGIYSTRKSTSIASCRREANELFSFYYPSVHRIDRRGDVLLDFRILHLSVVYGCLPRICGIFP